MTDLQETPTAEAVPAPSRRRFFAVAGAVGAGVIVAACSDDDDAASTSGSPDDTTDTSAADSGDASGDAAIAGFAAGLETLAVNTYKAGLDAATAGKLGDVPPAVAEFATTAMAHHQAAADALAEASGGAEPVVPADIEEAINGEFAKVKDIPGLARLALDLELKAAATYLDVLPKLTSPAAINLVGSILPIERQHAAVLLFVLGEYPVPETFATPEGSLAPA
ncbi:MAG: ferritin-like domain-containing protein [Acidimicrobiales bacterium]|nr:ferritin-like domain-containing protein [Acidimicrobiales bacterium]